MPNRTTRQTLQCGKEKHSKNPPIRRRRNLITLAAGIPVNPDRQHKKEPYDMSPYVARFIMDPCNAIHALHLGFVEAVATEDKRIIVPIFGDLVDGQEAFCTVLDGTGKLIGQLFCEVGAGMERRVHVVDWVDVG